MKPRRRNQPPGANLGCDTHGLSCREALALGLQAKEDSRCGIGGAFLKPHPTWSNSCWAVAA